jgi:hypothetical protein
VTPESQLAAAALRTLQGARALPAAEAAAMLRDFLNSICSSIPDSARLADASAALKTLVHKLDTGAPSTDDDWERSIETMHSLANEAS